MLPTIIGLSLITHEIPNDLRPMTANSLPIALSDDPEVQTDRAEHFEPVTFWSQLIYGAGVVLPFIGLGVAIATLWGPGFGWTQAGLLIGMYTISAIGVTVGYHRLFTHRAFEAPAFVRCILAIFGSMAVEGSVVKWAAMHRAHHQHSDDDHDPHSPHGHGSGFLGMLRGFVHAHVGWLFQGDPKNLYRYVPDLLNDPVTRINGMLWPLWAIMGLIIPMVLGGLITWSWTGALLGFLWGGLARIFIVHHVTWSINSVCHIWGTKPFRSHDESRNNIVFGILGLGEGWHNNHHAFPTSARHGLRWWEFDMSYLIIRAMALVGLAWNVKVPDAKRLEQKLAKVPASQDNARDDAHDQ